MTGGRFDPRSTPFVETTCPVRVRFQEVDALGVVWHGHYLTYFEAGRVAFGAEHRFDYLDIHRAGFVAPIVRLEIEFLAPARYGDVVTVRTRLHDAEGAAVRFSYVVEDSEGRPLATGATQQVFLNLDRELVLTRPAIFDELMRRCAPLMRKS